MNSDVVIADRWLLCIIFPTAVASRVALSDFDGRLRTVRGRPGTLLFRCGIHVHGSGVLNSVTIGLLTFNESVVNSVALSSVAHCHSN